VVHQIVVEDYIVAVEAAAARRERLTAQIEAILPDWTLDAGRSCAADNGWRGECGNADL